MIDTNFISKLYENKITEQINNKSMVEKIMKQEEEQKNKAIMQNLNCFEKLLVRFKLFKKIIYKQFEFHRTPTSIIVYKNGKPADVIKKTTNYIEIKIKE